jgi:hypothetical protein
LDAAKRLAYITLLAKRELLQEKKTDRATFNKVLKSYNLYDGNTRSLISKDKALVKEGKKLIYLSAAGIPQARQFVEEIRDSSISGKWTPSTTRRRRPKAQKNKGK